MKPPPFLYHRAQNVADALQVLEQNPDAKILAGGQSLLPLLNFRLSHPSVLVDINFLAGLNAWQQEQDAWILGALLRHDTLEHDRELQESLPLLSMAARHIGHVQIRHRGTLGGSLSHADPAAEWPLVMTAMDASFHLESLTRSRWIPASDFFVGYLITAAEPTEMLTQISIPMPDNPVSYGFSELAQRRGDFAIATTAVSLVYDAEGQIVKAAVALGGISGRPIRARTLEDQLAGTDVRGALPSHLFDTIATLVDMDDPHASQEYRQRVAPVIAERAVQQAWNQAQEALNDGVK